MQIRIHHKQDGTPYARPYLGKGPDGKPLRPYREFPGMSDDEARAAASAWAEQEKDGSRLWLGPLLNRYIDLMEADGRSKNTIKTYRSLVKNHAAPLANVPVTKIKVADLDDLFYKMMTGAEDGGAGLSPTTAQLFRNFLKGAFQHFVQNGFVENNVARNTRSIQASHVEAHPLDNDDLEKLLNDLEKDMGPTSDVCTRDSVWRKVSATATYLALFSGARVGEVCAIRRRDVWRGAATVAVNGTVVEATGDAVRQDKTKGKKSRTVSLATNASREIARYMRWQLEILKAATKDTPLFTIDGGYTSPSALSCDFARRRRALGLDGRVTFHSLRHTHATVLLQSGTDPRVVQERLGHADVSTTLKIYGHVMPGRDMEAAEKFGDILEVSNIE